MKIIPRPSLAERTTLRLGGNALAEVRLHTREDVERLSGVLAELGGTPHVLGGGSNLLVHDGDLPITVVTPLFGSRNADGSPASPELLRIEERNGIRHAIARIGAGIPMPRLLSWCAANGCSGLEGLVGIPGRLGGAIAMNAGAYGCSTAPLMDELEIWSSEGGLATILPDGWSASYRHFAVNGLGSWFFAVGAVMAFPLRAPEEVKAAMQRNIAAKTATQPVSAHTAGCVFKNPEGQSAGRLLDQAGMKGKKAGALFFSTLHANFLVHDTGASVPGRASDALELIEAAKEAVFALSGIRLETEVREWPCL